MKQNDRRLKIGVLGAGLIAQAAHFDACRKATNAELAAICDASAELLQRMAAIHEPGKTFLRYADMLADPAIDAVLLAVADQFHVPLALQALQAGKHVLVEKPLGANAEECEPLRQAVRRSGCILQVGHNRRFDPGWQFAHRFIREEIGALQALKAWYYDSTTRYTMTGNLMPVVEQSATAVRPQGNPRADRPRYLLLTHGSHLIDTARWLGGDIVAVQARRLDRFGACCWFIAVEFADGSLGHLDLNVAIRGDFEEGFQVFGEYGSVRGRLPLVWYQRSSEVECYSVRDGLFRRPLGDDAYTFRRQIEGFAATILDGAPQAGATVDDGLAVMHILEAIARSTESGQWIRPVEQTGLIPAN